MNTYKLKISYRGTSYEGWQVQASGHKTIQGELNKALEKITKSTDFTTLGSGRTDSGVHGRAQIVRVSIPLSIEEKALQNGLNSHLPKDIRVTSVESCDEAFHPVRDARWKRYEYLLYVGDSLPPQYLGLWTHCRFDLDENLMSQAVKLFEGEHDFINFSTKGTEVATTTRRVFSATVEKIEMNSSIIGEWHGALYKFTFVGEGFLKQMVRLMVGTLVSVGRGKLNADVISTYLGPQKEDKCAAVAAPDGLYLDHVEYDKDWA